MLILGDGWSQSSSGVAILTPENLTQAAIILIIDLVIICSNVIIIAALATGSGWSISRLCSTIPNPQVLPLIVRFIENSIFI